MTDSLTPTEHKVLLEAAQGLTTSESAAAHWKAAETVKSQRKRVMTKLSAKNITHAVYLAMRKGVIE